MKSQQAQQLLSDLSFIRKHGPDEGEGPAIDFQLCCDSIESFLMNEKTEGYLKFMEDETIRALRDNKTIEAFGVPYIPLSSAIRIAISNLVAPAESSNPKEDEKATA